MLTDATILEAVNRILRAAPGAEVVMFGSRARNSSQDDSDLGLLVIEPEVAFRQEEMVRLSDLLRPMKMPVDIIVVSRKTFDAWATTPGTVIYEAARVGTRFRQVA
jgi:predicted nucleotidyltransferase